LKSTCMHANGKVLNTIKPNENGDGLEEIDEAFNWLVLILSTLAGVLFQNPLLFTSMSYTPFRVRPSEPTIALIRVLVIPLIVLVSSWLGSRLIQNKGIRIFLKCFSWFQALMFLVIEFHFLVGAVLGEFGTSLMAQGLFLWAPILLPSLVYLRFIRNQYKTIFPESKFLNSNKKQALFCIILTIFAVLYWSTTFGMK